MECCFNTGYALKFNRRSDEIIENYAITIKKGLCRAFLRVSIHKVTGIEEKMLQKLKKKHF